MLFIPITNGMDKNIIIGGIFVLVLIVGGIFLFSDDDKIETGNVSKTTEANNASEVVKTETKYDKAPDFSLKDYDGNVVSLSDFSGKIVVANSWATWCPFCVNELPEFAKLQEEFPDDVVVLAIDRAESLSKSKQYTDDLSLTNKIIFLLDSKDNFYKSIGGFSMPETLFIDGEGNIRVHKRGPMQLSEMRDKVNNILQ